MEQILRLATMISNQLRALWRMWMRSPQARKILLLRILLSSMWPNRKIGSKIVLCAATGGFSETKKYPFIQGADDCYGDKGFFLACQALGMRP